MYCTQSQHDPIICRQCTSCLGKMADVVKAKGQNVQNVKELASPTVISSILQQEQNRKQEWLLAFQNKTSVTEQGQPKADRYPPSHFSLLNCCFSAVYLAWIFFFLLPRKFACCVLSKKIVLLSVFFFSSSSSFSNLLSVWSHSTTSARTEIQEAPRRRNWRRGSQGIVRLE